MNLLPTISPKRIRKNYPYTGEIFDKRVYSASWGEIEAPEPGTAEYAQAKYYHLIPEPII